MDFERKLRPDLQIPMIIDKSLAFLMEKGLNTEGLFRVPGSTPVINKYRALFDDGALEIFLLFAPYAHSSFLYVLINYHYCVGKGGSIDFLDEELGEDMTSDNIASLLKRTLQFILLLFSFIILYSNRYGLIWR